MKIRKTYERERLPFETVGESLTHQSMAPECDINRIMLKWQKTGIIEHANTYQGQYGDFTNLPADYHVAMNQIVATNEMFMSLPSSLRKRFNNDPGQFLEFVEDEDNRDEMRKLGLLKPVDDAEGGVIDPNDAKPPQKAATAVSGANEPQKAKAKPQGADSE